jgi:hypothetical protein
MAVGDRQHSPRTLEAGHLRDRLGKLRRFAERRDAEHSSRSAVQNHPVVNALRSEEPSPALLAHARLLTPKVLQGFGTAPACVSSSVDLCERT